MQQFKVPEDEEIVSCPKCSYFEHRLKTSTANFFFCKNARCGKASCYVCKCVVDLPSEKYYEDSKEYGRLEKESRNEKGMFFHFKCYQYKDMKKEFDEALDRGSKCFCPGCGVGGVKDDACTHMACQNCHTVWCYFCGKKEEEVHKDPNAQVQNIYAHNTDWNTNELRCPMYLT